MKIQCNYTNSCKGKRETGKSDNVMTEVEVGLM